MRPEDEDLATPGLDDFLISSPAPHALHGAELHRRIRALLVQNANYEDTRRPLPEDHSQRVLVCWRIARAMARIAGYTAEDETLDSTLSHIEPDPWSQGIERKRTTVQQQLLRQSTANELFDTFKEGLIPLLPPINSPTATERWCQIANTLAIDLQLYVSDIATRGISQMLDPTTAPYHNVTPNQILQLEELLVDEAQNLIIKVGERPAVVKFRQTYGFTRAEALGLMRLARAEALRMDGSTVDENRAIMSSQLKDFISRAKSSLNQRDELSALKELGRVQGLTRTEPEDAAKEFYNLISNVSQRHDQNALQRLPERVIDLRLVQSTDADDDDCVEATDTPERRGGNPRQHPSSERSEDEDEDPEAIKAFDRENLK